MNIDQHMNILYSMSTLAYDPNIYKNAFNSVLRYTVYFETDSGEQNLKNLNPPRTI